MHAEPRYWWHWWAVNVRWWWRDIRVLVRETIREFGADQCPQLAAGISYYVLFSIFPLALLFLAISGLALANESLREDLANNLFDLLPLSEGEGREDLESAISGLTTGISIVGLVSLVGLMWSASGMMGALRRALSQAWDTDYKRPFLHGKLLDFVMVLSLGILMGLSVGATIFLQVARRVSDDLSDALGPLGSGATLSLEVVAVLVPLLLTFVTFMVLFKFVPSVKTRFRSIWPGALLAAVLFEAVKNGFAFYCRTSVTTTLYTDPSVPSSPSSSSSSSARTSCSWEQRWRPNGHASFTGTTTRCQRATCGRLKAPSRANRSGVACRQR